MSHSEFKNTGRLRDIERGRRPDPHPRNPRHFDGRQFVELVGDDHIGWYVAQYLTNRRVQPYIVLNSSRPFDVTVDGLLERTHRVYSAVSSQIFGLFVNIHENYVKAMSF